MTKQQIIELLKSSKWTPNSKTDLFTDDESSETLAIWDKDHAFVMHCVRNKNFKDNVSLVVTQIRPLFEFNLSFESIEHVLNDSMKYVCSKELLNNKEEHKEFLKG